MIIPPLGQRLKIGGSIPSPIYWNMQAILPGVFRKCISSGIILWGESKHQLDPGKNFVLGTLEAASDIFFEGLKLK